MGEEMTIRVAAPLAEDLVSARLADPIVSDQRSGALDLFVQATVVAKDVSSVVLAVAGGIQGFRAILDWLQGRDLEAGANELSVTINLPDAPRSWSLQAGELDDATRREIVRVVEALGADS